MDTMSLVRIIIPLMVTLIAALLLVYVIRIIKKNKLEPKVVELITQAEARFKDGNGDVKFEYVFDQLYNKYAPVTFKIFFTSQEVRAFIQIVFDKVKIALDYRGE